MSRAARRATRARWLLVVPVGLIAAIGHWRGDVPMSIDEVYWVGSAYYYDLAFVERRLSSPDWQLLPARENPPVGKYLIGLALQASGRRIESLDAVGCHFRMVGRLPDLPDGWGTGAAYERRRAIARRVSPEIAAGDRELCRRPTLDMETVGVARALMMGLAALAAIALYGVGAAYGHEWTGLLASVLFVLHPIVVEAYTVALVDMPAVLFSILTVLCVALVQRATSREPPPTLRASALLAAAAGLSLGAALGTKPNAGTVAVLLAVVIAGVAAGRGGLRVRHRGFALGILIGAGVLALGLFVAVNPALYPDPWGGIRAIAENHRLTGEIQAQYVPRLASLTERLRAVAVLSARWLWLGGAAAACCVWQAVRSARSPWGTVALWWVVSLALVAAWIPFDWGRYVLPVLPPAFLLIAHAAIDAGRWLAARERGQPARPEPAAT